MILIVDFGSQTAHLIGRRIREMGVEIEMVLPGQAVEKVKQYKPKGIILSGGPSSVYAKNGLLIGKEIFTQDIPVLGICYGLEVMGHLLGGKVAPGKKKEYGPTQFHLGGKSLLFANWEKNKKDFTVWMSHFDQVISPPAGADTVGSTTTVRVAAFADERKKFYGLMFHPEVHHTEYGKQILSNFVLGICNEIPKIGKINISSLI